MISACACTAVTTINVHCSDAQPLGCYVAEPLNIHDSSVLNFVDADAWNNVIYFRIPSDSNVTVIPGGIFQRFHKLAEIAISTGLTSIRSDNFKGATLLAVLDLQKNAIRVLPSNVFTEANQLHEIDLSKNGLAIIEDFALNGLSKLERIYLHNNSLSALKRNTFSGAQNLKVLQLENNRIETIEEDALNLPNLQHIFLGYNRIQILGEGLFAGTPNLLQLSLVSNDLQAIGQSSIYNLIKLRTLDLNNNRIRDMDLDAFGRMPAITEISLSGSGFRIGPAALKLTPGSSLASLDISNNGLSASNILQQLKSFSNLDRLNLENNQLRELDGLLTVKRDFPKLSKLRLAGNRFSCENFEIILQALLGQHIAVHKHAGACTGIP